MIRSMFHSRLRFAFRKAEAPPYPSMAGTNLGMRLQRLECRPEYLETPNSNIERRAFDQQ
jgi:hypothetical protein